MKIGITYDLRDDYIAQGYDREAAAEFDNPETIEAIEGVLQGLGFETEPIGSVRRLVAKLAAGERWDMIFNIAEGTNGISREAQVPALLEAYGISYTFSDPLALCLALHKGMTKRVIRDLKIPTPSFAVVTAEKDVETIDLPFPLFAKPVAEGTSKGISRYSKVSGIRELRKVCSRLIDKFRQPVLVEEYLPGREFTVGITGTGDTAVVLGVMEILFGKNADEVYSFRNKDNYRELVDYALVEGAVAERCAGVALASWRGLGCRDAGRVDIRMDAGEAPHFIEVNPLPGLNPLHSDLPILAGLRAISYRQLIGKIIESAFLRTPTGKGTRWE
jgi:D-alanine-D-alanine ligase